MQLIFLFVLFCSIRSGHALTASEISTFGNGVVVDNKINATYYLITASGLPDHDTQKVNPNDPSHQNHQIWIKKSPSFTKNTCLPLGKIGVAKNGVSMFNPLTVEGHNAVEGPNKETFDSCSGHPTNVGEYHYHKLPNCLYNGTTDEFIGVALDGFAVYGPNVSELGRNVKNSDLDECHGRVSTINGVTEYRYFINSEYPYIMGCFRGDIVPDSDIRTYNASFPCSANATACNCPVGRLPRGPRNEAAVNTSNILPLSILIALASMFLLK